MEISPADHFKNENHKSLDAVFISLKEQAGRIDAKEESFVLKADTSLIDKTGNQRSVKVRLFGSYDTSKEPTTFHLTLKILDETTSTPLVVGELPFTKGESGSMESDETLTSISINDENLRGVGIGTHLITNMGEMLNVIFSKYTVILGLSQITVNTTDRSNQSDENSPGWTTHRTTEGGFEPTGALTSKKTFLVEDKKWD